MSSCYSVAQNLEQKGEGKDVLWTLSINCNLIIYIILSLSQNKTIMFGSRQNESSIFMSTLIKLTSCNSLKNFNHISVGIKSSEFCEYKGKDIFVDY